jgi:hypothetical protein
MSKPILAAICIGVALLVVVVWFFIPSDRGQTGPSDSDRDLQARKDAAEFLSKKGARVKEMSYPIGKAYAVDLNGLTISTELLGDVKSLGNVSELNLSKSTVTDEQLGEMSKMGLVTFCNKIDLSSTGITDAGLDKLENMVFLQHMNLAGTKCTAAGAARFKSKRESQRNIRTHNPTIKLN